MVQVTHLVRQDGLNTSVIQLEGSSCAGWGIDYQILANNDNPDDLSTSFGGDYAEGSLYLVTSDGNIYGEKALSSEFTDFINRVIDPERTLSPKSLKFDELKRRIGKPKASDENLSVNLPCLPEVQKVPPTHTESPGKPIKFAATLSSPRSTTPYPSRQMVAFGRDLSDARYLSQRQENQLSQQRQRRRMAFYQERSQNQINGHEQEKELIQSLIAP